LTRMFLMGNAKNASDYKLVTVDSDGIVRLLSDNTFGCQWIVILDIDDHLTKTYPAGTETAVVAEMRPKGVWPVSFDRDEQEMMTAAVCHQFGDSTDSASSALSARTKQQKKQMLKDYLMLFGHCCKGNKTVVAYDIALHFLDTEKALSSAIKVAMHHQLPLLAEQLSNLAKQRLESAQKMKQQQMKEQQTKQTNGNVPRDNGTPSNGRGSGRGISGNANTNSIKKPTRSLGRLKRPTAKLSAGRKNSNESIGMEDMTSTLQRAQLIGNKRPNNPCPPGNGAEPPKKRNYVGSSNPFSCSDAQRQTKKNSIFSV